MSRNQIYKEKGEKAESVFNFSGQTKIVSIMVAKQLSSSPNSYPEKFDFNRTPTKKELD